MDDWQEEVLRAGLGERSDGSWAARQIATSCSRQNGKSEIIVARILAGLLLFDEKLIIVSAHRQDTSREVFFRLTRLIEDHEALDDRVDFIGRSEMREYIRMKTGQEVRFKARSVGAGRGFSADCLLLDEAQLGLGSAAWSAILPTMSARPNAQVWLFGTPPRPGDPDAEVFNRFRDAGLGGKERRLAYLEWSADKDDDLDAVETWAKANPAFPVRISHDAIASERSTMSDEQFCMERLGMWAADTAGRWVIPQQSWNAAGDLQSQAVDRFALGIECAPDLEWASIALAGQRADGRWHVELVEQQNGTSWVVGLLQKWLDGNPGQIRAVVVDAGSPTKVLFDDLQRAKVRVTSPKVAELGTGCTQLLNGIVTDSVRHTRQGQMDAAVAAAGKRALGDTGMWVWSRRSAASDITPIQAATLALIGAQQDKPKRPAGTGERTKMQRRVVVRS